MNGSEYNFIRQEITDALALENVRYRNYNFAADGNVEIARMYCARS